MLYPADFGEDPLFPSANDFEVLYKDELSGRGVFTRRSWARGQVMARMAGYRVDNILQHTLQISSSEHNHDPFFSGYFLHACEPNISLNMQDMTVTALKPIAANSWLYMDYAETEDYLFRIFPCGCGTRSCRGWVIGRMQQVPMIIEAAAEERLRYDAAKDLC